MLDSRTEVPSPLLSGKKTQTNKQLLLSVTLSYQIGEVIEHVFKLLRRSCRALKLDFPLQKTQLQLLSGFNCTITIISVSTAVKLKKHRDPELFGKQRRIILKSENAFMYYVHSESHLQPLRLPAYVYSAASPCLQNLSKEKRRTC